VSRQRELCAKGTPLRVQDEAVDVDAAFVAADALGAQALAAAAEDAALEDALYALDQALEAGALPADAYLKQVRCGHSF
jgi:hypothetical protein